MLSRVLVSTVFLFHILGISVAQAAIVTDESFVAENLEWLKLDQNTNVSVADGQAWVAANDGGWTYASAEQVESLIVNTFGLVIGYGSDLNDEEVLTSAIETLGVTMSDDYFYGTSGLAENGNLVNIIQSVYNGTQSITLNRFMGGEYVHPQVGHFIVRDASSNTAPFAPGALSLVIPGLCLVLLRRKK